MRHKARKKLLDTFREALAGIQIINQKLNGFFNFKPQTGRLNIQLRKNASVLL